jgi:hypothetical protein
MLDRAIHHGDDAALHGRRAHARGTTILRTKPMEDVEPSAVTSKEGARPRALDIPVHSAPDENEAKIASLKRTVVALRQMVAGLQAEQSRQNQWGGGR